MPRKSLRVQSASHFLSFLIDSLWCYISVWCSREEQTSFSLSCFVFAMADWTQSYNLNFPLDCSDSIWGVRSICNSFLNCESTAIKYPIKADCKTQCMIWGLCSVDTEAYTERLVAYILSLWHYVVIAPFYKDLMYYSVIQGFSSSGQGREEREKKSIQYYWYEACKSQPNCRTP